MKAWFRTLTAGALVLCLTLSAGAAADLSPIRSFDGAGFTDVPEDWSRESIVTCYELGLMSGKGPGVFDPAGTVTAAEAVAVAARLHSLCSGGTGQFSTTYPWYYSAVDYAQANGLLAQVQFPDYSAVITRAQLAQVLSQVLPQEEYAVINRVDALPDVDQAAPYAESVLLLYRAGVLTGVDASGSFAPEGPVTRSQLSAVLCRLVKPERRQRLALFPVETSLDAVLAENDLVLVEFSAAWCHSCQELAPTMEALRGLYPAVTFYIVDTDVERDLTLQWQVEEIPTVFLFRNGQQLHRLTGAHSQETYTALLDSLL